LFSACLEKIQEFLHEFLKKKLTQQILSIEKK